MLLTPPNGAAADGRRVALGVAAQSVWAKSLRDPTGRLTHWLPLHQHLDDTEAVAARLFDDWLPQQVIKTVAKDVPGGADGARRLACWLAGVHDVGKASPAFAVQVPTLADRMRAQGLVAAPALTQDPARGRVTHALVSHLAVRAWLVDALGFSARREASQFAAVVGGHHGVPPDNGQLEIARERTDLAGVGSWEQVRVEFLERAINRNGGSDAFQDYRAVRLSQPSQVLLTAIVIVADWIASNADLFPLLPVEAADSPTGPTDEGSAQRISQAWADLALPPNWTAARLDPDLDLLMAERFGIVGSGARPVQAAAVLTARQQAHPGLIVIEAPMGEGKTEAALLATEVLAHASGAGGCFVALPTQATSDAMFARVLCWLRALPGDTPPGARSVHLAHGKAALNDDYKGLVSSSRYASIAEDEHVGPHHQPGTLLAHHWLGGRKKGVLASFVVGTIDQVLFAGLKSRHLALRHLALAGKVVVIDEAHAYDVFMSTYLDRVLHWLGAYGVPVVVLSATLPVARRAQMIAAYENLPILEASSDVDITSNAYPLVVGADGFGGRSAFQVPPSSRATSVRLDHLPDGLEELVSYLRGRLAEGGCAVVVRNTVGRVQETAQRLEGELGEEHVTVHHSRFLSCDRARTDRALLSLFGSSDSAQRPALHIVVGSQVVEQSLDVDFDLLVTDLAPVDLVLQRMGRLHRHRRESHARPAPVRVPRCAVVGVEDWTAEPVRAVAGSRRVYDEHALLRSAALLEPRVRRVVELPADISPLVQRAYGNVDVGPPGWQQAMAEAAETAQARARDRIARANEFRIGAVQEPGTSLIGWLRAGVGDADDSPGGAAQVRDAAESLEVLVVQRDADGGLQTPSWIESGGGEAVPMDQPVPRRQARTIAACSLRLPPALCHPGVIDDVIRALEANHFTSFHQAPLLTGELVLVLDTDRTATLRHGEARFRLTYDLRRGLLHERE